MDGDTHARRWLHNVSVELVQVAVFLAAFSGLYFTVIVVTDETYRASSSRQRERAGQAVDAARRTRPVRAAEGRDEVSPRSRPSRARR